MTQQVAIIILIDVAAAVRERTLKGNAFLFDNMKLQGSEGEGTWDLTTTVNGVHWSDGSQADEQVLNWLPYALGSIPPTVPRTFHVDRARALERETLDELVELANRPDANEGDLRAELARLRNRLGTRVRVTGARRGAVLHTGEKLMDVTGGLVVKEGEEDEAHVNHRAPVITDVTGEAVDQKVIYPAMYGSPDLVTDGWYWSAAVDTSRPGTFPFTMQIQLYEFVWRANAWVWQPMHLELESKIRITRDSKRNGFTMGGLGALPMPAAWPVAAPASGAAAVRI